MVEVATYRHNYWAEPKDPTQFGSVSGSEIQNLPFSHSGIVSLYRSEPKNQPNLVLYLVQSSKIFVSVATLGMQVKEECTSPYFPSFPHMQQEDLVVRKHCTTIPKISNNVYSIYYCSSPSRVLRRVELYVSKCASQTSLVKCGYDTPIQKFLSASSWVGG